MTTDPSTQLEAIRESVARHIANGLVSTIHIRAKAARDLATELDANGANVDNPVDQHLINDGYSTAEATTARAAADPDPWAPKPSITEYVPKPVRDVLADRLAHMLLSPAGSALQLQARELTFALRAEGFDLSEPIKQHITDLTLGPDRADVPF
ncbi:hypothetical protein [Streptomyces sp. W4I9-2]|uniref:hypothetical protein n=1 Tax=Streptomyces sp. W4I9-2 TaxID=3042297 RepID=UPI00278094CF|nr:hypothetical protein [Streptomyces sp. W4I9-2]MDQ0694288.1 hypothetical protein [Streptomyces sp. W4I9-2]